MQIQVNTDRHITGEDTLTESIRDELQSKLKRFADQITRVEVHLSDENSDKRGGGDDIRCLLEIRLERHQPTAVTNEAANVKQAFSGEIDKAIRQLDSTLGKIRNH